MVSGCDGKYSAALEIPDKGRLLTSTERSLNAGWDSDAGRSLWIRIPSGLDSGARDFCGNSLFVPPAGSNASAAKHAAIDSTPTVHCDNRGMCLTGFTPKLLTQRCEGSKKLIPIAVRLADTLGRRRLPTPHWWNLPHSLHILPSIQHLETSQIHHKWILRKPRRSAGKAKCDRFK